MVFQKLVITKDNRRLSLVKRLFITSENTVEFTIKPYGRHVVLFNVESIACSQLSYSTHGKSSQLLITSIEYRIRQHNLLPGEEYSLGICQLLAREESFRL
jgi:hypothetical protein